MQILDEIQRNNTFTTTEKNIINYLLINKDSINALTINQLAKLTYSSNASIIRLCHKLGYSGYKTFKINLLKELEAQKYIIKTVDYNIPFDKNQTADQVVQSIFSLYSQSLPLIQTQLDTSTLSRVAQKIIQAKRTFIYAIGDSKLTAWVFVNKLNKINYFPIIATENREEVYISDNLNFNDFALFISYQGTNETYLACMRKLKIKKVTTCLITANPHTPLAKITDLLITVPNQEGDKKIATFYSQFAFNYILNLIFSLIYNEL